MDMKQFPLFSLMTLVGVLSLPCEGIPLTEPPQETIQRSFNVSAGQKVHFNLKTGGSIRVSGWDRPVVSVDAQMKGRDAQNATIDFEQTASGVKITSRYVQHQRNNNSNIELEVHVPRKFDIEVETMGGEIRIAEVEGRMSGKTMGGELHLTGIKGEVNLTTMGGEITLTNSDVDGSLHTMGGKVQFQDVIGNVKGSSMGGNVVYRNVRPRGSARSNATADEVVISTMGGEIRVEDAPVGANVSTMGGNITVGRAAKFVKAKTMGGDISIAEVDGWVDAETMGGNVSVQIIGGDDGMRRDVTLSSKGGDITLTASSALPMDFELELAYTRNSSQNYRITSDFPIQVHETQGWDYSKGEPRRIISGAGSYSGGKNRIRIATVNGNIVIKRGR
jgi:DUF4097 and DUF4098 domain-containing protein YvlB